MKSIINIDVFTLEHVLKNLKLIDMCRVAYANKHMREAVRLEFSRRYQKKIFVLNFIEIEPDYRDEAEDHIIVYSLGFNLRFLHLFGDLIDQVTICFPNNCVSKLSRVLNHLGLFCSSNLRKISFRNLYIDIFGYLNRTFINVEEIVFESCTLNENMKHYSLFFPNIKAINFQGWNIFDLHHVLTEDCELLQPIIQSGVVLHFFD